LVPALGGSIASPPVLLYNYSSFDFFFFIIIMASAHEDQDHDSNEDERHSIEGERRDSLSQFKPGTRLTLERYLQDLPGADTPIIPIPPKYHTGKIPNSKSGDGKPRLLLMGQRRCVFRDDFDTT
jgi:hypothetical protein